MRSGKLTDGELQVTGDDTSFLVVTGGVAGQLEDLGSKVLEDGGEIDRSTGTDTLSVVALPQQTVDTSDGESETGLGRTAIKSQNERKKKTHDQKHAIKNDDKSENSKPKTEFELIVVCGGWISISMAAESRGIRRVN